MKISAPCHLEAHHYLDSFCCGESLLDTWLKTRARKNEASGASRTYVITRSNDVVGYYSLAVGSVSHALVPGRIRRNMPDPIPVMLLARLAVDTSLQGQGIGRALLRDAILRTEQRQRTLRVYGPFWSMPCMSVPKFFTRDAASPLLPSMN